MKNAQRRFVICIHNDGYPVSLEVRKVYRTLADEHAERRSLIRVIDESGEDYLYPAGLFLPIEVSRDVEKALTSSAAR